MENKIDIVKKLKELQVLRMNINYLVDKYKELKSKSTGIKSPDYSQIPAGSHVSNIDNMMDINLIQQEEITNKIRDTRNKIDEIEQEVSEYIERLEPKEQVLIRLHYIEGETLEYICGVIQYSFRHTFRIHKKALEKLSEMS